MNTNNELKTELEPDSLDRREFVRRTSSLAAVTAIPGLLSSRPIPVQAATKGGHVRVGSAHGSTTDSLDPATSENGFTTVLNFGINNHLLEIAPSGELVAEVAQSWEASSDAKTWIFKLRKDVEFHNGKTVSVEDVIASIDHHRHADSKSAARSLLQQVVEISKDGDIIKVVLSAGNADFPFIISDHHIAILPSKDGKVVDASAGVGCGGYQLTSFEPGVRAALRRHPNYWKPDRAHFDEAELLSIIDTAARTNALKTGAIDVMNRCDLKTVHLLAVEPDINVEETTGTAHYTIPMRTDIAPFDDNHVRLALKHGLDRELLLTTVFRGHGTIGNDHPISIANRYHAAELEQRIYDPDKAQWHLKQAGLDNISVDLSAADAAFTGAIDAAVLYKEQAAPAGININVVREPDDGYWAQVWMHKPWCMCYWAGRQTEDAMFSTAYQAHAAWNDTFWNHELFNQLLLRGRTELDDKKRREIYVDMQRIVRDDGGVVVPLFNNYVFASSRKLGHGQLQGNWDLDGSKLLERWWFV